MGSKVTTKEWGGGGLKGEKPQVYTVVIVSLRSSNMNAIEGSESISHEKRQ
jgi:hypothetical protein